MAKSVNAFPEDLRERLDKRESTCKMSLESTSNEMPDLQQIKLSRPPNPKMPFVVGCLELHENKMHGRHIVTNRDLQVGDVVAIEKAFAATLPSRFRYERCENCCEEHSMNLIPCKHCTVVMFCSEECRSEAMDRFHRYECPIINLIEEKLPNTTLLLALRSVICAVSCFESADDLIEFTKAADTSDTVFNIDYRKDLTAADKYRPVYGMQRCTDSVSDDIAAVTHVLNALTSNETGPFSGSSVSDLIELYCHHLSILHLNRQCIADEGDTYDNVRGIASRDYTLGMFPLRFLFNHSCDPNMTAITKGTTAIIVAQRPVKAGQQLCFSYG